MTATTILITTLKTAKTIQQQQHRKKATFSTMKTTATTKQGQLQKYGQQHQRQLKIQQYIDNNIKATAITTIQTTTTSKTMTVTSI